MELKLEPLNVSDLSNMEVGQLMKRHLSDMRTIDPALLNDVLFRDFLGKIKGKSDIFDKALAQVQKSEETDKIASADGDRDLSASAFGRGLKLFAASDDEAEVEASRSLSILFKSFKNLKELNYEAETNAIDKLISELDSPAYSEKVTLLGLNRYVERLRTNNDKFKNLFGGRMVSDAMNENFDMKIIRKESVALYADFCAYIALMSRTSENPLFKIALSLLNTGRKYYADLLARRQANNDNNEEPAQ